MLGLAAGDIMPASGDSPEGAEGISLDVDPIDNPPASSVVRLFASFGVGPAACWAYFRLRSRRWIPAKA